MRNLWAFHTREKKKCVDHLLKNEQIQLAIIDTKWYSIDIKGTAAHKVVGLLG